MNSPSQLATTAAYAESAVYLTSGTETVFAVHTSPAARRTDIGVVLAHSGANNFSSHRNGVWTRLARRLADEGVPALRFDFAGTGESSGEFVLGLAGQPVADVAAAMDALRSAGCRRLLVVGSCFGGIPAIQAAVARDDVAGLILLSPPLVLPGGGRLASLRERFREVVNGPVLRTVTTNREYRRWFFARLASFASTRVTVKINHLRARIQARRTAPGRTEADPALEARAPAPVPGQEPAGGAIRGSGLLLENELARLVTAGSHVEAVFGTADGNVARVEADPDASRAIRLLRGRRPAGLAWTLLDGPVHGLEDAAVQEQLIRLVTDRARHLMARPTAGAG